MSNRGRFRVRRFAGSPARLALGLTAPLACLVLAACAVGPDFKAPPAPRVDRYTRQPLSGDRTQQFKPGGDVRGDWWTLFHSQALDALVRQSVANNPDLQAAQAALVVAREETLSGRGAAYPAVTAGFSASRQQDSPALNAVPISNDFLYNLFTPQVSVSYVPDVFGLNRRNVESLEAQQQGVRYQMIATYNTLTANVVATAIQTAALGEQLKATQKLVDLNTRMLRILRYQLARGYASRQDVAAQEAQLAQVRAGLPDLRKQWIQQRNLLAALTGRFPSQMPDAGIDLGRLQLPRELPVSLPSRLVEQRPDVLQARANLHAASAQVGVAIANRLPEIELTADAGRTALAIGQVFKSGTGFWGLGAAITAPVFEGGALMHQERAAKAAYVQAAAQYRSTVLTAFEQVADTLTALEQDAQGLKAATDAERAARVSLALSQRQEHDGYASPIELMNAEQAWQQARIGLVQARANRYLDTVALYQALGGGWWHRTDSSGDTHEN